MKIKCTIDSILSRDEKYDGGEVVHPKIILVKNGTENEKGK